MQENCHFRYYACTLAVTRKKLTGSRNSLNKILQLIFLLGFEKVDHEIYIWIFVKIQSNKLVLRNVMLFCF